MMRLINSWSGGGIARILSFIVLIAIILVIGGLFFQVMSSFFIPLFLAAVLVVLCWPLHERVLLLTKGRLAIAAGISTTLLILIVVLPIAFVTTMASLEVTSLIRRTDVNLLQQRLIDLRRWAGLEVPQSELLRRIEGHVLALEQFDPDAPPSEATAESGAIPESSKDYHAHQVVLDVEGLAKDAKPGLQVADLSAAAMRLETTEPDSGLYHDAVLELREAYDDVAATLYGAGTSASLRRLANPTEADLANWYRNALRSVQNWVVNQWGDASAKVGEFLLGLVILIAAIYFFFLDGPSMVRGAMRLSPLDDKYEEELLEEFDRASRSVVLALVLSAVAQGLLAGVAYAVLGVPSLFLLTLLTTLLAFIPFIGAGGVYIPVALGLWLMADRPVAAIILTVWGIGVVSTVDNFVKPWILSGQAKLNPLLGLLSVIGGVKALGPIGLLLGPMVAIYLLTLLKILQREVVSLEADAVAATFTRIHAGRRLRPYGGRSARPGGRVAGRLIDRTARPSDRDRDDR